MPKHGMTGQRNAAKNKGYDSTLNFGCKLTDKDGWKEKAKSEGKNVTDWANEKLNKAKED